VSISANDPLNLDALSAPFTVTNTSSFFTLTNVATGCDLRQMNYEGNVYLGQNRTDRYESDIPELLRGSQDTIYCEGDRLFKIEQPTLSGDVLIYIHYGLGVYFGNHLFRIPFVGKRSSAQFIIAKNSEGKVRWLPYGPLDRDPASAAPP
jgi:hypothetical protein